MAVVINETVLSLNSLSVNKRREEKIQPSHWMILLIRLAWLYRNIKQDMKERYFKEMKAVLVLRRKKWLVLQTSSAQER